MSKLHIDSLHDLSAYNEWPDDQDVVVPMGLLRRIESALNDLVTHAKISTLDADSVPDCVTQALEIFDEEVEVPVYTVEVDGEVVHDTLDMDAAIAVHKGNPGSVLLVDGEELL